MWSTPNAEAQPVTAARPTGGLNLRVVLHTIRRHPIALFGVFLFAGVVGLCLAMFMPLPNKTAAVSFRIAKREESIIHNGAASDADFESYRSSQLTFVQSPWTLRKVLLSELKIGDEQKARNKELYDKFIRPLDEDGKFSKYLSRFQFVMDLPIFNEHRNNENALLAQMLKVESRPGSELLRIKVEGDDEEQLLILISFLSYVYNTSAQEEQTGTNSLRSDTIEKQYKNAKSDLKTLHDALADVARTVGGASDDAALALMATIHQEELRTAHEELRKVKDEKKVATELLARATRPFLGRACAGLIVPAWLLIQPHKHVPVPPAMVSAELSRDKHLQELDEKVNSARKKVEVFNPNQIPPSDLLIAARLALATAEERRSKYFADAKGRIEARLQLLEAEKDAASQLSELVQRQVDYERADSRVVTANKNEDAVKNELAKHYDAVRKMSDSKAEIVQKEKLIANLLGEMDALRLKKKAPSRVSLAEEPYIVPGLAGNRKLQFALVGGIAAFFLGFAALVFWELRSRTVTHADEVSTALGTPLIGTIPPLVRSGTGEGRTLAHADLVEAVDTTRIMLMHGSRSEGNARVLLVSSALAGEGKTTLSGNLAISLTRAGFRTLLIDGDTRSPTAQELFGIELTPGLGELLREEADLDSAIRNSHIPGLSILPAGNWTVATHQLLVGSRWRQLQRQLKEVFDFVVLDTSPLLLVSDTLLMAREADGVVLSVLLGVSQVSRVSETVHRLQAVGAKVSGVVVNNVRSPAASHAYAYRARYAPHTGTALLPHSGLVEVEGDPIAEEIDNPTSEKSQTAQEQS